MAERYLITGGAGFIGTNLAAHYLDQEKHVTVLDDLSRPGSSENLAWLTRRYGHRLRAIRADIRDTSTTVREAVGDADVVFHMAGQVAVTTSVEKPVEDFDINARGTLNLLEAVRSSAEPPAFVYASTNKVYGQLEDVGVVRRDGRYAFADASLGIPETRPLDFHSPYGCSKGAADQYVIDYARIYGLRTLVFRQSCIYGNHQYGVSDQGWISWFALRALERKPVTIYGDGGQVRDVLHVDDLIAAYDAALEALPSSSGRVYNIGGGPSMTLSLIELIDLLENLLGYRLEYSFADWRPGDQRVFVSDIRRAAAELGWSPSVRPADGIRSMLHWMKQERGRAGAPAATTTAT
ncbi:MAG TPA: NAD-dependent epimerase/dehydratase family protein [Vicinamibacterales bacterium]|nr:NAD-dependent epimerase/dehydratase family protein [Vicinamibacterales bacterium]